MSVVLDLVLSRILVNSNSNNNYFNKASKKARAITLWVFYGSILWELSIISIGLGSMGQAIGYLLHRLRVNGQAIR